MGPTPDNLYRDYIFLLEAENEKEVLDYSPSFLRFTCYKWNAFSYRKGQSSKQGARDFY